jgi:hypothetical protein
MRKTIFLLLIIGFGIGLTAQNLDIQGKARIQAPDTAVALDIEGGGIVLPRLSTQERDNISNPKFGQLILNTSNNCLEIFLLEWTPLCSTGYTTQSVNSLLGGVGNDRAWSVSQSSDGSYIVAGSSSSSASGDVSGVSNGGEDYWIVKLNSGGGIEWDTLLGGSGDDLPYSISQTSDGGYIVAGESKSSASGDVSGINNGDSDYWIVKLNSGGGIEWDALLGGGGEDGAWSISQTSDSGYIVAGYSPSSDSGDVSGMNNGDYDYWIVKLDSGGGIEWDTLLGGGAGDYAFSISQTADGGYIVGGYSESSASGDVSGTSNGGWDYWIVKLNNGGGIEWDTLLGGGGIDFAFSISQTSDGGYIVGGYSTSSDSGDVSGINNGNYDYWIVKLNSSGGIEWDTLMGGFNGDYAQSISQTSDGGYIVGGYSNSSASGDVSGTNNGATDYWIVKLNSGGGIEWDALLGGNGEDAAWSIFQTSDGNYIVAGYSTSSANGDVSGITNGGNDYWIITLDQFGQLLK